MAKEKNIKDTVLLFVKNNSTFMIFAVIFIFASLRYEEFFTYNFIKNLIVQNTMIGLLAFGMSFVIIAGDIDLSVGSVMALCGVIAAKLSSQNILIVFAVTFGVGIFWGFLNGFMVAKMDIVPFIATLATMVGVRGIVHIITGSKSVSTAGCTEVFKAIGHGELIPYVPNTILIYLVVFAICMFVQRNTRYGRHNYAVGGNLSVSKMMGINGTRIRILNYVLSGVMAAIAALIMTSRLGSGQYSAGDGWEMDAIASTVIGGTLLTGGVGDVKGTFFGVLILGIIKQIFNLQGNLNTWWQNIATGLILLAVVVAQSIAKNRK